MRRLNGWNDSNDRSKGVGGREPRVINIKTKPNHKIKVMILTEDGFKCKRGETMWAIGVTFPERIYRPLRVKAHARGADYNHDGLKVWKEHKNCMTECDLRNSNRPKH